MLVQSGILNSPYQFAPIGKDNKGSDNSEGKTNDKSKKKGASTKADTGSVEEATCLDSQPPGPGSVINGGSGDDMINEDGQGYGPIFVDGGSGDDVINIGGGPPPGPPGPEPPDTGNPVAANEQGRIWGDPHFVGGDGGKFDIQGEAGKIYNLLSDSNLVLRGQFDDYKDGKTVVGKTGLTVGNERGGASYCQFSKDGTAQINGQQMEEGKVYDLADGGTAKLEDKTLTITTAEGYTIKQTTTEADGEACIELDVNTGETGVDNGQMPTGLLGQTFDADNLARNSEGSQGEGAIQGQVQDYERSTMDPLGITPVAAEEHGRIWGDPHFVGGDGGKFDVQGEAGKIYNLLSDFNLVMRGLFEDAGDGKTVVGETGVTVGNENGASTNINFRKDGSARINGQLMEDGKIYKLADGGVAQLKGKTLRIKTAEGYGIKQKVVGEGDDAHIDSDVYTGKNGVYNGQMPTGLLGQTFDVDSDARNSEGAQGEDAIQGQVQDYVRSALDPIDETRGLDRAPNASESSETTESARTGDTRIDFTLGGTNASNPADSKSSDMISQLLDFLMQLINMLLEMMNTNKPGQADGDDPDPDRDESSHHNHHHPIHINGGSGDDKINLNTRGNYHVNGGSGDDTINVNFHGESNRTAIDGGSGLDTAVLPGNRSDYTVTQEGNYSVFADNSGNSVRISNDVENVRFH